MANFTPRGPNYGNKRSSLSWSTSDQGTQILSSCSPEWHSQCSSPVQDHFQLLRVDIFICKIYCYYYQKYCLYQLLHICFTPTSLQVTVTFWWIVIVPSALGLYGTSQSSLLVLTSDLPLFPKLVPILLFASTCYSSQPLLSECHWWRLHSTYFWASVDCEERSHYTGVAVESGTTERAGWNSHWFFFSLSVPSIVPNAYQMLQKCFWIERTHNTILKEKG